MVKVSQNFCLPVALLALTVTACGGKDALSPVDAQAQALADLRAEIREIIVDADRADRAIAVVDRIATDLDTLRTSLIESKAALRALNADYDAPRAEFEALVESSSKRMRDNRRQVARHRRDLLDVTTRQEWAQLARVRSRTFGAMIKAYQSI